MSDQHEQVMRRALELARCGAGLVSPNPMVGAVLVRDGEVVGEGYHRYDRVKHAEMYALERAGSRAIGATLFCSLEPCCHHGRTPPCTTALIEAGITRAVVAVEDPNPWVNGKGIADLMQAGIEVTVGVCETEARSLNECYFKFVSTSVPFVHVVHILGGAGGRLPRAFLETAREYDAVMLGGDSKVNREVLAYLLRQARHRPLVVVGSGPRLGDVDIVESHVREGTVVVTEPSMGESGSDLTSSVTGNTLRDVASHRAMGLLVLAGPRSRQIEADRLTLIHDEGCAGLVDDYVRGIGCELINREEASDGTCTIVTGRVRPSAPETL